MPCATANSAAASTRPAPAAAAQPSSPRSRADTENIRRLQCVIQIRIRPPQPPPDRIRHPALPPAPPIRPDTVTTISGACRTRSLGRRQAPQRTCRSSAIAAAGIPATARRYAASVTPMLAPECSVCRGHGSQACGHHHRSDLVQSRPIGALERIVLMQPRRDRRRIRRVQHRPPRHRIHAPPQMRTNSPPPNPAAPVRPHPSSATPHPAPTSAAARSIAIRRAAPALATSGANQCSITFTGTASDGASARTIAAVASVVLLTTRTIPLAGTTSSGRWRGQPDGGKPWRPSGRARGGLGPDGGGL